MSANRDADWQPVCRVEDIPPLGARRVARAGTVPVAVFRGEGDHVFALLDRCPHKGGPLSQGIVFGDGVACPLHNWTIVLADGCARAPDAGCTQRFAVKVEDGLVHLDGNELRVPAAAFVAAAVDPCASASTRTNTNTSTSTSTTNATATATAAATGAAAAAD